MQLNCFEQINSSDISNKYFNILGLVLQNSARVLVVISILLWGNNLLTVFNYGIVAFP